MKTDTVTALERIAGHLPSHIPQLTREEQGKAWSLANTYLSEYDWDHERERLPEGLTARLVAVFEDTSAPEGALNPCVILLEKDAQGVAVVKMDGRPGQVEEVSAGYVLDVDGWGGAYMRLKAGEGNILQANPRTLIGEMLNIPSQSFMEPDATSVFGVSIPKYEILATLHYADKQPLAWAFRTLDGKFGLMTENIRDGAEIFDNAEDALDALCEQMPSSWSFQERLTISETGANYYEMDEAGVPQVKDNYHYPSP